MADKKYEPLGPEDYAEPRCLLCDPPYGAETPVKPIPQQRVVEKLDEYTNKKDYEGAKRHLEYWLSEAQLGGDVRGELVVRNELMGITRKMNLGEEAVANASRARELLGLIGNEDTLSGATTLLNAATVYCAFDQSEKAVPLFEKTREIYEKNLPEGDARLGGLFNNMGMALAACRRYGEAYESFQHALHIVRNLPNGKLEEAMTYLNMASATEAEHGLLKADKKIEQYLEQAETLLKGREIARNGYAAFVFEKCASVFEYYGWFLTAKELFAAAEEIYHAGA